MGISFLIMLTSTISQQKQHDLPLGLIAFISVCKPILNFQLHDSVGKELPCFSLVSVLINSRRAACIQFGFICSFLISLLSAPDDLFINNTQQSLLSVRIWLTVVFILTQPEYLLYTKPNDLGALLGGVKTFSALCIDWMKIYLAVLTVLLTHTERARFHVF